MDAILLLELFIGEVLWRRRSNGYTQSVKTHMNCSLQPHLRLFLFHTLLASGTPADSDPTRGRVIPCCELAVFATSRGLGTAGCVGAADGLGLDPMLVAVVGTGEADLARKSLVMDTLLKVVAGFLTSCADFEESGSESAVGMSSLLIGILVDCVAITVRL